MVDQVKISGDNLNVGTTLTGSYVYAANGAGADKSLYDWTLDAQASAPASTITTTGNAGSRELVAGDAGKVVWLTVKAQDVNAVAGNLVAVSTAMSDGGTCAPGGDCTGITTPPGSTPPGQVQTGTPVVDQVKISGGDLFEGTQLTGSYVYAANGAGEDRSLYRWDRSTPTEPSKVISATGVIPPYTIGSGDIGFVLWLTVKAQDVNAVAGNTVAVSTAMSDGAECVPEAQCNGITNPPGNGGLVIGRPSQTRSTLVVTTDNALSDGTATNSVTATFLDAQGAPVANAPVTFTVSGSTAQLTAATVNTNASGVAVADVKDSVAEVVTVGATAAGVGTTPATVEVTFIGVPDATKSTLAVTTDNALSDGTATNSVTATFLDAQGAPVANAPVTFTVSGSTAQLTAATVNTNASGVAVAEVKDTVPEAVTVSATAMGVGTTPASVNVTFTAPNPDALVDIISVSPNPVSNLDKCSVSEPFTYTVILKKSDGTPVAGASVYIAGYNVTGDEKYVVKGDSSLLNTNVVSSVPNASQLVSIGSLITSDSSGVIEINAWQTSAGNTRGIGFFIAKSDGTLPSNIGDTAITSSNAFCIGGN